MYQQRCPLFWRDIWQKYFILINPPHWFSKVDLACIINIRFSGTRPLDRSINYLSEALGVLGLFIWSARSTGGYLGLLVCFGCTWSGSVLSLRVISQLEPLLLFQLLEVSPSLKCALYPSPNHLTLWTMRNNPLWTFPIPRVGSHPSSSILVSFTGPYHSPATHQHNYFPCALNAVDLFLATPILDATC